MCEAKLGLNAYPAERSGPPHLLGPWGWSAGDGGSGLLEAIVSRPP